MRKLFHLVKHWLTGLRPVRRLVDDWSLHQARARAAELDRLDVAGCQKRTLIGLVHQAAGTRFGRDHDFRRIRTLADYRRLVPLRTPSAFWKDYWQPALPQLEGVTWPGPITRLARFPGPARRPWPLLPVSPALLASHRAALRTALGLMTCGGRRPASAGRRLCCVGAGNRSANRWEDVLAGEMASVFRAGLVLPSGRDRGDPEPPPARQAVRSQITWMAGTGEQLARLLTRVRQLSGCPCVGKIWPGLSAVLSSRSDADSDAARLRDILGDPAILLLEAHFPPEGPVAVEDPRHGLLRLLPDLGTYFEFVPVEDVGKPLPVRLGAGDVDPGVPYALALTSPAGLWSCLTGTRVCFERRDPPLFRLLEAESPEEAPAELPPLSAAHPFPIQAPHPRNGGAAPAPSRKEVAVSGPLRGYRDD